MCLCFVFNCGCVSNSSRTSDDDDAVETSEPEPEPRETEYTDVLDPGSMSINEVEEYLGNEEIIESYTASHDFDFGEIDGRMEPVESSAISEVGYSEVWSVLAIRFRNSGDCYAYFNVPHEVYTNLVLADSIGGYFNSYIKPNYDYEIIG